MNYIKLLHKLKFLAPTLEEFESIIIQDHCLVNSRGAFLIKAAEMEIENMQSYFYHFDFVDDITEKQDYRISLYGIDWFLLHKKYVTPTLNTVKSFVVDLDFAKEDCPVGTVKMDNKYLYIKCTDGWQRTKIYDTK